MDNIWFASFLGAFFGSLNGFLCRLALKKHLNKSNAHFMSSYLFGLFYKLFFLILSILILNFKKSIILIAYSLALIFFQVLFELKPLKK